jgi:hypothetical protein
MLFLSFLDFLPEKETDKDTTLSCWINSFMTEELTLCSFYDIT